MWAAVGVLVLVAAGMSYQSWRINRQAARITEEAERANRESASATEVSDFLIRLFQVSNPGQGRGETVTARELLDKAATDIQGRLEDQPIVKARLLHTLAQVHEALGLYQQAQPLAAQGLRLRQAHLAADDPAIAQSQERLGWLQFLRGDLKGATPLLRDAAAGLEAARGADSLELAGALSGLAVVLQNQGETAEARSMYQRALSIHDRVSPDGSVAAANALSDLAFLEVQPGQLRQGGTVLPARHPDCRAAAGVRRRRTGHHAQSVEWHVSRSGEVGSGRAADAPLRGDSGEGAWAWAHLPRAAAGRARANLHRHGAARRGRAPADARRGD